MKPTNEKIYYTPDELLEIFKEQHRLCSPLDIMADATFTLTRETKIWEWRAAQDLLEWPDLAKFLNQEFRVQVPLSKWKKVFNPDKLRTLGDVCDFLSTVAEKELIAPVKRLGAECLSAAIFLTLKRNLKNKGVDVSALRPSTPVAPFLEKNFSPLMEEVTLTGVRIFDKLEYGSLSTERRLKYWLDKFIPTWIYKRSLQTGDIQTFRDLVEKIIENDRLGTSSAG